MCIICVTHGVISGLNRDYEGLLCVCECVLCAIWIRCLLWYHLNFSFQSRWRNGRPAGPKLANRVRGKHTQSFPSSNPLFLPIYLHPTKFSVPLFFLFQSLIIRQTHLNPINSLLSIRGGRTAEEEPACRRKQGAERRDCLGVDDDMMEERRGKYSIRGENE